MYGVASGSLWGTLVDIGAVAAALTAIGLLVAGLLRTPPARWITRAITRDRDERFAERVAETVRPIATDLKREVRDVINTHTVDEMAAVHAQTLELKAVRELAERAHAIGEDNSQSLQKIKVHLGIGE